MNLAGACCCDLSRGFVNGNRDEGFEIFVVDGLNKVAWAAKYHQSMAGNVNLWEFPVHVSEVLGGKAELSYHKAETLPFGSTESLESGLRLARQYGSHGSSRGARSW